MRNFLAALAATLLASTPVAAQTTLQGNHTVNGSLTVVGSTQLNAGLTVTGNTQLNGALNTTGNGAIGGSMTVAGGTNFLNGSALNFFSPNADWTAVNSGGNLNFYSQYAWQQPSRVISFKLGGEAIFPQKMSIGDVSCTTPSQCAVSATAPLGINTLTLAVGGKIGARGAIHVVNYGGTWPDYVFAPTYRLTPLKEVEQYIQANSHLPEMPSTAQVAADGLELVAMDALLLKKVEELTLYLIRLEKENEALRVRVAKLEN